MSAVKLLQQAREAGLTLSLNPDGGVAWEGPTAAFQRLKPQLLLHRNTVVEALQAEDRQHSEDRHEDRQRLAVTLDRDYSKLYEGRQAAQGVRAREGQTHGLSPETHARLTALLSRPTPPDVVAYVAARMDWRTPEAAHVSAAA